MLIMKRRLLLSACVVVGIIFLQVNIDAFAKISIHPQNNHYLIDNGKTILLIGGANIAPASSNFPYKPRLDAHTAGGSNYGRIWSVLPWEGTSAVFPWARTGGGVANDGGPKFNLDQWDPQYWQILRDAISYAATKGVYLQYMVFDEVGLEQAGTRWNQHPFNPSNNVNGLVLPSGNTNAVAEFYDLGNAALLAHQEAYVDKVLAETCQYGNVIYEIANETTAPWVWQKHFIDFINQRCDSLISNNPFSYKNENLAYGGLDIVNFHNLSSVSVNQQFSGSYYSYNKAIKYDEQALGTQTDIAIRKMGWGSVLGGGHINWDEDGNHPEAHRTTTMLSNFFKTHSVGLINMVPHNELVDKGYALVNKGVEYLTYNDQGGPLNISLVDVIGMVNVEWYDPKTGNYSGITSAQGGKTLTLVPPFSGDVVLYITKGTTDTSPPTTPITLSPNAVSGSQIDLSWSAASDPESGIASYKVYRNGLFLNNAFGAIYSDTGLSEGTQYSYEVSAVNGAGLEGPKSLMASATTFADVSPPTLVSVSVGSDPTQVAVVFSEPLEAASAETAANYSIDNGVTVSGAVLGSDLRTVTLSTSLHSSGSTYTLSVSNVRDQAASPNVIAPNSTKGYLFASQLSITNLTVGSSLAYEVVQNGLENGALAYIDRSYAYSSVPALVNAATYIKTANDDKTSTGASFLAFDVDRAVGVYVAHDDRIATKPSWLSSFGDAGEVLMIGGQTYRLWQKNFPAGTVALGGNGGTGNSSMYTVILVPQTPPPAPPDTTPPLPPAGLFVE